jgi:hypothetical protein
MLTEELQVYIFASVLEPSRHSKGYTNFMFRDRFVAGLASIVTLPFRGYLLFAFWTTSEVHLSLIVIHDALEVARELKVLGLGLSLHKLVVLMERI